MARVKTTELYACDRCGWYRRKVELRRGIGDESEYYFCPTPCWDAKHPREDPDPDYEDEDA